MARAAILILVLTMAAWKLLEDPAPIADERGAQVSEIEIDSEAVDASQPVSIVVPSATAGETAPGAFDDAEDFAAHDVVAAAGTDQSLPGGHEGEYWNAH